MLGGTMVDERPPGDEPPLDGSSSPTAGGRAGWLVIAVVALALLLVMALTAFWGDGSSPSSAASEASGSTTSSTPSSLETSSTDGGSGSCTAPSREPLDPTAAVRLLPNAPEPTYASDPPTSGAFVVGPSVEPTPSEPLRRPVQVGLLAQGKVLIQYDAGLPAADVADLQGLAGDDVVVAPNPTLGSPIVATAWRVRQDCADLDLVTLRRFATLNANQVPDAEAGTTTTTTGG